jgi:hypothetical protein
LPAPPLDVPVETKLEAPVEAKLEAPVETAAIDEDAAAQVDPVLPSAPRSRRWLALVMIVVAGASGAYFLRAKLAGVTAVAPQPSRTPEVIATATTAPSVTTSPEPSAVPSAETSAQTANLPDGMGLLKTEGAAPGRRIFVDQRVVEQTPASVIVKCGARLVKIGSNGQARIVEIPCGGEVSLAQ